MEAVKVGQRFTDVEAMGKEKEKQFPVLHRFIPCHCLLLVHSLHEEVGISLFPITTSKTTSHTNNLHC